MATMGRIPAGAIEADDMPALARAFEVGVSRDYLPGRGVSRDVAEEMGRTDDPSDDDGWEFPELDENGHYVFYDDYDRWSARMDAFYAGRGELPA